MTRRRYRYSYSPPSKQERERVRPAHHAKQHSLRGWLAIPFVLLLAAGAVVLQQSLVGGGDEGSAASQSNCWTEVACSAERVSSPPESKTKGPDGAAQANTDATSSAEPEGEPQEPPVLSASAAAVIEEPCHAVVHSYNAHTRLSPASLTKIVTALVAAERVDLAQTIDVTVDGPALSASTNATIMGLQPGQSLGMVDLLYGMLLPSGNDAALQIAEYIAGNEAEFADLMNAKVKEYGLEDSHFANPHGLDEPGHYTSAYDIALLGSHLLDDPDLAAIVGTRSYQPYWDGPRVNNLNLLLGQYPGALGVKTGYTPQAGQTIVAAAERNGRRFIVAVLGSADNFADATALLDWAFASAPSVCKNIGETQVAASP
jgi:D-alanyl-D-alanine carboxypeptidase